MLTMVQRPRVAAVAGVAILAFLGLGAVLLVTAMTRYPGGTVLDPQSVGHSFWVNFLCDLTSGTAVNGRSNQAALLARSGLVSLGLALCGFWLLLPVAFSSRGGRATAAAIRILGLLSILGLMLAPVARGKAHVAAVFASCVPALVAGVLGMIGTVRHAGAPLLSGLATASVMAAAAGSLMYARSYLVQRS